MSSASAVGRPATSATRTSAPETWSGKSRPGCSESVVTTSSPGPSSSPDDNDVAPVRRRAGERDAVRRRRRPGLRAARGPWRAMRARSRTTPFRLAPWLWSKRKRSSDAARVGRDERAERARVQIREALEHRELGARPPRRSCDLPFDRRVIREHRRRRAGAVLSARRSARPLRARGREHDRSRSESGPRIPTPARSDPPASGSCAR